MKLGPDMYHLNNFYLHQNEGGSELGGGRSIKKTIKRRHEVNIISALTGPNNSLKKSMKLGVFLLSSLTIWLYVKRWRTGRRGVNPPYGGCFLLVYIYNDITFFLFQL